jgi:glycosyltransferase involved in cell wall biosynthesis
MTGRMSVAVYAIIKNEGAHLDRMLASTKRADDVVIVDTGSTDDSVAIAQGHGATVHHATIVPWRYDTARNMALALVPASIDLCQRLDGDEVLSDNWRDVVDNLDPVHCRWQYRQINHSTSVWGHVMRDDLHRRHGFFWRNPTHEWCEGPPDGTTGDATAMWVDHYPDETKVRYNVEALRTEHHRNPLDHRMAFYYARELLYSGDYVAARRQFWQFLDMPKGWDTERGEAYRHLASIDAFPERWLWKAIGENALRREPFVDLATLYADKGRWAEAAAVLMLAQSRDNPDIYTTDKRAWGEAWDALNERIKEGLTGETAQP